jgi:hypothetical protein
MEDVAMEPNILPQPPLPQRSMPWLEPHQPDFCPDPGVLRRENDDGPLVMPLQSWPRVFPGL